MADCVAMLPPGVKSPDGVTSPAKVRGTPSANMLLPLVLLRCACEAALEEEAPAAGACWSESNGFASSALDDEGAARGVVCGFEAVNVSVSAY